MPSKDSHNSTNCYVVAFLKSLNMSSLIANKVKTNMYLFSFKLFIVRIILCATVFNLYNAYNNNYSFIILLSQLFAILLTTFCKQQHWLNYYWLLSVLSCLFICRRLQPNEGSWRGKFGISPSRECEYIVVLCSTCYVRLLVYPFFSRVCCYLFTCPMYLCHVYCVHIWFHYWSPSHSWYLFI